VGAIHVAANARGKARTSRTARKGGTRELLSGAGADTPTSAHLAFCRANLTNVDGPE
jgi:hypothetical protein